MVFEFARLELGVNVNGELVLQKKNVMDMIMIVMAKSMPMTPT